MAAVIRLKRRREDDPVEILMATSKRFKDDNRNCKLTFAGTAKSEEACLRVVKTALHMEMLEQDYAATSNIEEEEEEEPMCTSPADDLKVVAQVGVRQLDSLFSSSQSKTDQSVVSGRKTKFQLLDLEKESKDSTSSEYVYDIFYTKEKCILEASVGEIVFSYRHASDLESDKVDEAEKEEADLQANYFEDDAEEEEHWTKDYPDEYDVFYRKKEDNPSSESEEDDEGSCGGGDDECHGEAENDYGEYLTEFMDEVVNSRAVKESRHKILDSATSLLEGFHIDGDVEDANPQ